jgi:hypothetical protein
MALKVPLVLNNGEEQQLQSTDAIQVFEIATPSTPASGQVAIYAKSDHNIYKKDSTGTETQVGGGSSSPTATTVTIGKLIAQERGFFCQ